MLCGCAVDDVIESGIIKNRNVTRDFLDRRPLFAIKLPIPPIGSRVDDPHSKIFLYCRLTTIEWLRFSLFDFFFKYPKKSSNAIRKFSNTPL